MKQRKSAAPDHLEPEQLSRLREWCQHRFPQYVDRFDFEMEKFLARHQARGTLMKCWEAGFREWMLKHHEFNNKPASEAAAGLPLFNQEQPEPRADGATVSQAFSGLSWRH